MWFDAEGHRMSAPDYPGFDTLHTLETIMKTDMTIHGLF